MVEKVLILKVDLSCSLCRNKMEKILKKYQDEWNIKKVNWDAKNNKITLSGPFDPDELIKKLCCKACKTIKEFTIPDPPKPAPPKPEAPKPEPPKPEPPKPEPPKPEPPKPEPPKPEPPKPEPPKPEPPKPEPPKPEPPKPDPEPPKPQPPTTICLTGQVCLCGPCHANKKSCNCDCSSGRKPCSCDGGYWWNYPPYPAYPAYPPYPPAYGRPTCQFYNEDEPSACAIM